MLVACTLNGFVTVLNAWERPDRAPADWKVPRDEVNAAVDHAMERHNVAELVCDPPGWIVEIDTWAASYGSAVVEYPTNQRSRMAAACDRFRTGVLEGDLTHDGSPLLARHIGHCVAKTTPFGTVVTKDHPDSPRKIDAAIAATIAYDRAAVADQGPFVLA